MVSAIKTIIFKSAIDIGTFVSIVPMVDAEVITQFGIAGAIVVFNIILLPLFNVLVEYLKYVLKKHLPIEIHDDIDKIGKKTEEKNKGK
jgi:hypothetical protein